jgi:hypothetical protein
VAKPKTLVQRLMPAVHLVAVWALLVYFVLVAEPAAHGAGVEGEEPGGIGFAWRWRQLAAGVRKAQLGRAGFASGWGVQALVRFSESNLAWITRLTRAIYSRFSGRL